MPGGGVAGVASAGWKSQMAGSTNVRNICQGSASAGSRCKARSMPSSSSAMAGGTGRVAARGAGMPCASPRDIEVSPTEAMVDAMSGCEATTTSCPALCRAHARGTTGYRCAAAGHTVMSTRTELS